MNCFKKKLQNINAIILDVDGVLTNGMIGYSDTEEIKFYNAKDGHAIKLAKRAGLKIGVLSGRSSKANDRRFKELSMDFVYQGKKDKKVSFLQLLEEQNLNAKECLYVGDDLVDIPVMKLAGFACAVADASEEAIEYADFVSQAKGGEGAVREIIVHLLKAKNLWKDVVKKYYE